MNFQIDVVIKAPIEVVFEAITKDDEIKKWNDMFIENKYESEEQRDRNEPGTKYTTVMKVGKNKVMSFEGVLVEYDAPNQTSVRVDSKEGIQTVTYKCEVIDNQTTRVIVLFNMQPKNIYYKIMASMVKGLNKMVYKIQFESLIEYLEGKGARYERSYAYYIKQFEEGKLKNIPFWYEPDEGEVLAPLSEEFHEIAEEKLGVKLPDSYIKLLKVQNGGYLVYDSYPSPVPTSWADDHVNINELFGISFNKMETSILNSSELIEEWGLPDGLVLIAGDGHTWIALDYREVKENPAVILVDSEKEQIVQLAPDFDTFLLGLTVWE